MTESLVWRDAWLLGIEPLDRDHQAMVHLINRLAPVRPSEAGADNAEHEGITRRLDALINHLRAHFESEDAFLEAIRFPGRFDHKGEHALELAELVDLKRSLELSGETSLQPSALRGIKDWFCSHVVAEDKAVADFYFSGLGVDDPKKSC